MFLIFTQRCYGVSALFVISSSGRSRKLCRSNVIRNASLVTQFADAIKLAADLGDQSLVFTEMQMGVRRSGLMGSPHDWRDLRPVNSRATPSSTSRSQYRRAGCSVIGIVVPRMRGDSIEAGATASSVRNRSTAASDPFARSFGATVRSASARRARSRANRIVASMLSRIRA